MVLRGGAWLRSLPSWLPLTSGNLSGAVSCVVVAFLVLQGVSAFRRPALMSRLWHKGIAQIRRRGGADGKLTTTGWRGGVVRGAPQG